MRMDGNILEYVIKMREYNTYMDLHIEFYGIMCVWGVWTCISGVWTCICGCLDLYFGCLGGGRTDGRTDKQFLLIFTPIVS